MGAPTTPTASSWMQRIARAYDRLFDVPMPYMMAMHQAAAGQPAPDFSLRDQNGQPLRLSSLRGHRVLLVFYRGHW